MEIRSKIGMMGLSLVMMALLVACNTAPGRPAPGTAVEAAVHRAERELEAAEANVPNSRKTSEAYASLPY